MADRFSAASSTLPFRSRKNTAEAMAVAICGLAAVEDINLSLLPCGEICAWLWKNFVSKASTLAEERIGILVLALLSGVRNI